MTRRVRQLLILGLAGAGLWTLRRVLVNRAAGRSAQGVWPSELATAPAALGRATTLPLPAAPIIDDLQALRVRPVPAPVVAARIEPDVDGPPPRPASGDPPPPVADEPSPAEPEMAEPEVAQPVADEPKVTEPGTVTEPVVTEPVSTEPVAKGPAMAAQPAEPTVAVTPGETVEKESHLDTANLERVRERLASIRVDVPTVRGVAASVEVGASVRSRTPRGGQAWQEPGRDGTCPQDFPIKVKLRSRLFHLPGMLVYGRTHADRCYAKAEEAEADGFTRAKR